MSSLTLELSGTGMGIALSSLLGPDFGAIIPTCLLLSAFHLSATYTSVRRVGIPTFDSQVLVVRCLARADFVLDG